ncbi:hypothetical protein HPB51_010203 [Rhipicephalus microplus]|uniref:Transporter n=1 Tax=Rhipicephalus microplus TaxID=6941 RepID=A0A9J6F1N2_RHIMP|nr:hypothetical protein HPB51_010203 [Rhipicephalus microplus]
MAEGDQWGSKCTFLLSLIGMSVGMGNVWRFPYVVYINGGGAFIIPYITLTIIAGRPMYLLELVLGQFSGYAQTKAFDGYPIARGKQEGLSVGWAMVYASVSLALFNSMVLAYVIIYLYYSMWNPTMLPWTQCDPSWADEQCYVKKEGIVSNLDADPTGDVCLGPDTIECVPEMSSFYFHAHVVKAIYITTTLPFGLLLIILARVLALPGASMGLKFFIVPKWREVLSVTLWGRAAEQVILSLGLGYGTVICYAGYGRIRNKLINDLEIIIVTQFFANVGFGLVIFSVLGFLASDLQIYVEDIITSGFDLAFVAYPEAVSHFRNASLWVVCFYASLFCMALNAQCATVQAVLSPVRDEFSPAVRPRRWVLAATGCLVLMLFGLPMTRQDGIFTLKMFNAYFGDLLLPMLALFETCFVVHGYGLKRFSHDITFMLKKWRSFTLMFLWKYLCPAIMLGICITNIVFFERLHVAGYDLPQWMTYVGITLLFMGLAIVVAFCVYHLYICDWDYDEALAVNEDWGPRDPDERLRYHAFLKSQDAEAAVDAPSEDTTTDARSQGRSSGEEGESDIDDMVAVAVEEIPPEATAVMSDSIGAQSEDVAQCSDSDHNAGLARTLVISESGLAALRPQRISWIYNGHHWVLAAFAPLSFLQVTAAPRGTM